MTALEKQGQAAKLAARKLVIAGTQEKNDALYAIADALIAESAQILAANAEDMASAEKNGMKKAMLDRLLLNEERLSGIAAGVREVAALKDPIGEYLSMETRPNGLIIGKKRVPLGVIGIIYEARPNVSVDCAALCLKSGNAVILRGGSEAFQTNRALVDLMRKAIASACLPEDCVSLVQDTSRASANELMGLTDYVDVLIPRGGAGLIRTIAQNAKVPVIRTGEGNCHIYVDSEADLEKAAAIVENAKCSRPSVCNAMETLLIAREAAPAFLPLVRPRLDRYGVELRCDEESAAILGGEVTPATEEDWATEYDDYILAVKVVEGLDEALAHIARYSTGHSEAILTENYSKAQRFLNEVDAAAVYVNASTRFTDGGEFGLGAEIGISTQKMHARGPMGLGELTSTKYVIYGNGQVR